MKKTGSERVGVETGEVACKGGIQMFIDSPSKSPRPTKKRVSNSKRIDIFISHAFADKLLVSEFVDLLNTGIGVSPDRIRCTSLNGLKPPFGSDFIELLRAEIMQAKAVIFLLSPNFYQSKICLCELGAAWAFRSDIVPLLVPPLSHDDISDVFTLRQRGYINVGGDLSTLRDFVINALNIKGAATARWDRR